MPSSNEVRISCSRLPACAQCAKSVNPQSALQLPRHQGETHPIEEDCCLSKDVPRLLQFTSSSAEGGVAFVHLNEPSFVLVQLDLQLVPHLRYARTDEEQRSRFVERATREAFLFDLAAEEADSAGHFVDAPDLTDE